MEKNQYEKLKKLKSKVENGTANFKERNVYNIIQKRKRKGQSIYINVPNENNPHR